MFGSIVLQVLRFISLQAANGVYLLSSNSIQVPNAIRIYKTTTRIHDKFSKRTSPRMSRGPDRFEDRLCAYFALSVHTRGGSPTKLPRTEHVIFYFGSLQLMYLHTRKWRGCQLRGQRVRESWEREGGEGRKSIGGGGSAHMILMNECTAEDEGINEGRQTRPAAFRVLSSVSSTTWKSDAAICSSK